MHASIPVKEPISTYDNEQGVFLGTIAYLIIKHLHFVSLLILSIASWTTFRIYGTIGESIVLNPFNELGVDPNCTLRHNRRFSSSLNGIVDFPLQVETLTDLATPHYLFLIF